MCSPHLHLRPLWPPTTPVLPPTTPATPPLSLQPSSLQPLWPGQLSSRCYPKRCTIQSGSLVMRTGQFISSSSFNPIFIIYKLAPHTHSSSPICPSLLNCRCRCRMPTLKGEAGFSPTLSKPTSRQHTHQHNRPAFHDYLIICAMCMCL